MEQTNITHLRQELSLIEDRLNDSDNFVNEHNWSRDYWKKRSQEIKDIINTRYENTQRT